MSNGSTSQLSAVTKARLGFSSRTSQLSKKERDRLRRTGRSGRRRGSGGRSGGTSQLRPEEQAKVDAATENKFQESVARDESQVQTFASVLSTGVTTGRDIRQNLFSRFQPNNPLTQRTLQTAERGIQRGEQISGGLTVGAFQTGTRIAGVGERLQINPKRQIQERGEETAIAGLDVATIAVGGSLAGSGQLTNVAKGGLKAGAVATGFQLLAPVAAEKLATPERAEFLGRETREDFNVALGAASQESGTLKRIGGGLFGSNVITRTGASGEAFESSLRESAARRGLTESETQTFIEAQQQRGSGRTAGTIGANLAVSVFSESQGQRFVTRSFAGATEKSVLRNLAPSQAFKRTAPPIAAAGALEGGALTVSESLSRDELPSARQLQTGTVLGAGTAGLLGGGIAATSLKKSDTFLGKTNTRLQDIAFTTDPFEKAGDIVSGKLDDTLRARGVNIPEAQTVTKGRVVTFTTTDSKPTKRTPVRTTPVGADTKSLVPAATPTTTPTTTTTPVTDPTPTFTPTFTPTAVPVGIPVNTPVSTPVGTPVNVPVFVPTPQSPPFFLPRGASGRQPKKAGVRGKQRKRRTPTGFAAVFNIRGKESKIGTVSGLGIRPIQNGRF